MRNDKFLKMENIHWFVFEEAVFNSTPYMFWKCFKINYNLFALLSSKAEIFICSSGQCVSLGCACTGA